MLPRCSQKKIGVRSQKFTMSYGSITALLVIGHLIIDAVRFYVSCGNYPVLVYQQNSLGKFVDISSIAMIPSGNSCR